MDIPRKRAVLVVDYCCMCKRSEESVDHLMLHYEIVRALCNAIFNHGGLAWVMAFSLVGEGCVAV
jgi:hypothetical protein